MLDVPCPVLSQCLCLGRSALLFKLQKYKQSGSSECTPGSRHHDERGRMPLWMGSTFPKVETHAIWRSQLFLIWCYISLKTSV